MEYPGAPSILPAFDVYGSVVPIAKIDGPTLGFAYSRGERDVNARTLDVSFVDANALDVCRMRHDSARDACKAIHLFYEVVAYVISDTLDRRSVYARDPRNMWRINDELPTVGDDRLQLIGALATDPKLFVHRWSAA